MKKKLAVFLCSAAILACTPMSSLAGTWQTDSNGTWYQNEDGSYPVSCWQKINDEWVYFDNNGYLKTGWLNDNDSWYFFSKYGTMRLDPLHQNGLVYYFNENGSCINPDQKPDWEMVDYTTDEYLKAANEWREAFNKIIDEQKNWSIMEGYHQYDEIKDICNRARPILEKPFRMNVPDEVSALHRETMQLADALNEKLDVLYLLADSRQKGGEFDTSLASSRAHDADEALTIHANNANYLLLLTH